MNLICLVVLSAYSNIYSKMEGGETETDVKYKWEQTALELRWQPQFDLVTESCSRQEFGWLTVEIPKIMPCIMYI